MKISLAFIATFLVSSVASSLLNDTLAAAPCTNPNLDDITFKIERERHKSRPRGVRKLKLARTFSRDLYFQVRFRSDARYTTATPSNQYDWNKLLGFTTNRIHKNSLRLGWRWNPTRAKFDLGFYGYRDSVRTMPELTSVDADTWVDVHIHFSDTRMAITADGVTHEETGAMGVDWGPISTWLMRTAYFGGDEKSPQTMHIDVRGITVDRDCAR